MNLLTAENGLSTAAAVAVAATAVAAATVVWAAKKVPGVQVLVCLFIFELP